MSAGTSPPGGVRRRFAPTSSSRTIVLVTLWVCVALSSCSVGSGQDGAGPHRPGGSTLGPVVAGTRPDRDGYFQLLPVGSWSELPSGTDCASRVHRSPWEPRPENALANHHAPDPAAVRTSFAVRPRSSGWVNWNTRILPRVDGAFTGTTDEIFQWAACKWGLPDNLIRAIAAAESNWYQGLTYPNGRCVDKRGCGDFVFGDDTYCDGIDRAGHAYQNDYGPGVCPKTFSIVGVMDYEKPSWGRWPDNQNGTFPFNRDSTAFAVDYLASTLRACFQGWEQWLKGSFPDYGPGDIWGCVGVWYSGDWHSDAAQRYISRVRSLMDERVWLQPSWAAQRYECHPTFGCPR